MVYTMSVFSFCNECKNVNIVREVSVQTCSSNNTCTSMFANMCTNCYNTKPLTETEHMLSRTCDPNIGNLYPYQNIIKNSIHDPCVARVFIASGCPKCGFCYEARLCVGDEMINIGVCDRCMNQTIYST